MFNDLPLSNIKLQGCLTGYEQSPATLYQLQTWKTESPDQMELSLPVKKQRGKHSLPAFFELVEFEICQQLQVSGQQQLSPLLASNLSRKQRNMKINLPSPTERQHVRVISMSNLQSGSPRFDLFRQLPGFVLGGPLEFRYYAMFINNQLVASC